MHKTLTKNDCLVLVDTFSRLKSVVPYETVRNMGILTKHVKQFEGEEKNLIASMAEGEGVKYLYESENGKFVPIKDEEGNYITLEKYEAMPEGPRTEFFLSHKDIIFHEVAPEKFEEYVKVRQEILMSPIDDDNIRKVLIKDSTLQNVSDSLVAGTIKNVNNLKEKLGDCILILEEYGYIDLEK